MADGMMHNTIEHDEKREENAIREDATREPVKSPEGLAAPENSLAEELPQVNQINPGFFERMHEHVRAWRHKAIKSTPNFIVNNSSNILGATHVATEVMMLKASAAKDPTLNFVRNNPKFYHYATDPVVNTWKQTVTGSMPKSWDLLRGNPFKNFKEYLVNGEYAAGREYEHYRADMSKPGKLAEVNAKRAEAFLQVADKDKHKWKPFDSVDDAVKQFEPGNRWQTRSTLFGLAVWTLSALIPDKKEDPEEVEKMAELQQRSKLGYAGERLRQAVAVPEWRDHKRQMIGLGVSLSGVCSVLGAWRSRKNPAEGALLALGTPYPFKKTFARDTSYLMQSLFTLGSGLALLFSLDDEKGFSRFGMGMMGRLTFLPVTIGKKFGYRGKENNFSFVKGEPENGKWWYTAATASFQAENMAQGLIGGAEKNPDGTIIDHASIRKEAKMKATIIVAAKRSGEPITDEEVEARMQRIRDAEEAKNAPKHDAKPGTTVSHANAPTLAMPERVASQSAHAQA